MYYASCIARLVHYSAFFLPTTCHMAGNIATVTTRGGYTHTWAWQEGSVVMTPVLGIFNLIGSLFNTSTQNLIDTFFLQKTWFVSVTFSSRDTRTFIWSNFSPTCIILQILIILYQFYPCFSIQLILDLFDPSFSQNLRSYWVHFCLCAEPGDRKFGEVPCTRVLQAFVSPDTHRDRCSTNLTIYL